MDAIFRNQEGEVGRVTVGADGHATPSSDGIDRLLASVHVVEPRTLALLARTDGDRYVAALPANFAGSYVWATLDV